MANEQRTVKVQLDVGLGPEGTKALSNLENAIKGAGNAYTHLRQNGSVSAGGMGFGGQQVFGGTAPIVGGSAGSVSMPNASTGSGLGIGGIGRYAGAAAIGAGVMQNLNGAYNSYQRSIHDQYSTTGELQRAAIGDMAGGQWALRKYDQFTGRAYKMEQNIINSQIQGIGIGASNQIAQYQLGYNPEMAGLSARSGAFASGSAINQPYINRSTSAGAVEYQEQSRLLPVKREIAKADREQTVATAERLAAQKELDKLIANEDRLSAKVNSYYESVNRNQDSGPDRDRLLKQQAVAEEEFRNSLELTRAGRENLRGKIVGEAQATGQADMARSRMFGAQADNLEARADRGAASYQNLGTSSLYDQQFGVASLQAIVNAGTTAGIPPEMLAAAQRFGPSKIREIAQKSGESSPFREKLHQLSPEDYPEDDPEQLRQQAAGLRAKQGSGEYAAEGRIAKASEAAGENIGKAVVEAINRIQGSAVRTVINGVRQGRGQGGGPQ